MTNTTAMGTLLFVGALFLSLNALAVSARPGDVSSAERSMTAIIPEVPISAPVVTGGGLEAVPVPPPALNPSLIGGSRPVAKQPRRTRSATLQRSAAAGSSPSMCT